MNWNWASQDVQQVFDMVDSLLFSYFESWWMIIGQHSTYWSMASHTFEGCSRSLWAYRWLFTWDYDWYCFPTSLDDWETTINPWGTGIEWPAMRNNIPCVAHIIQLGLGAFMCIDGVNGHTTSWEAHERDLPFGEKETTVVGKSQRLRKEGNARINNVSAMRPGLAEIIEKVRNWRHFEKPETAFHRAENACCVHYSDSWFSKRVHWLSTSQRTNCSTTDAGCENTVQYHTGVAWVSLPIMRILPLAAQKSDIEWSPATLHNTGGMDHRQVRHGRNKAIPILYPVDIEKAYSNTASGDHCPQWHPWWYGWCYKSFGWEE